MNQKTRDLNAHLFGDETKPKVAELFPTPATTRMLDEHESVMRTNATNDGRGFQKEIEFTAGGYNSRNVASFRKVDPPVRIIWPYEAKQGRKVQRVIFQPNPWLDFVGTWTARGGRMLLIEAKSTSTHRLAFNNTNGLTSVQWTNMKSWRIAGAASALIWRWNGKVVLFTPEMLRSVEGSGAKSLVFENGLPVPAGEGAIIWDFLPVLANALWPPQ